MSAANTYENAPLAGEGADSQAGEEEWGRGEGEAGQERGLPGLNPVASQETRSMSIPEIAPKSAIIVPDERRLEFLPSLFGSSLLIVAENAVYSFMDQLSPLDYRGGHWDFYEHDGKPLFMAPRHTTRFRITGEITGFQGDVSAEAAGIIATLFTFSHLSFRNQSERLSEGYAQLHTYCAGHPEATEILQAID